MISAGCGLVLSLASDLLHAGIILSKLSPGTRQMVQRSSSLSSSQPKCVCESSSVVSNFLWPHGLYSLWNSPGHSAGVGSLSLLQGIFPTQDWTQVSRIIGGFFTSWTTRIFLSQLLTVGSPRSNQDHKLSLELGMGSGTESPRVSVYEWFHKRTILVLSPEERGVLGWLRCGGDMRRTNQVWVWV